MQAKAKGRPRFLFLLLACALAGAQSSGGPTAPGESSSDQAASVPLFRANSRLVMVDVVATDSGGHFVPGLKASDFSILEDGKPQKLWAFGVHTAATSNAAAAPAADLPALPPHQFSNFPLDDPSRPITIVLMDLLNTAGMEQAYARKEMLKFLRELPSGQCVALFTLTTHLTMLQGFTSDGATLAAAAKMLLAKESPLTTPEAQVQQDEVTATMLEAMAVGSQSASSAAGRTSVSIGNAPIAPIAQAIRRVIDEEGTFQQGERTVITLENLKSLARAVSGYPGRKSLIWLSADFPIQLGPDFQARRELRNSRALFASIQQTAALLTASQIAVFPVDVGGLRSRGTGMDISTPVMVEGSVQEQAATSLGRQTAMEWDSHEAMGDVARETGGQPFYGTNDLKTAMSKSLEQGSNYYTLAYVPSNRTWDGNYRKIEVKSASGYKLNYRRGYYGVAEREIDAKEAGRLLVSTLALVVPPSSMILLRVQVLPPDADHKRTRIDYAVDANDVSFSETPEHRKRAVLDFMTAAWSPDHKLAGQVADTMETEIRPEVFQQAVKTGLPMHQELDLKPGSYTLRLGVIDRATQRVGTVDVPLTVGNGGAAADSPSAPKP